MTYTNPITPCNWFALCTRPATTLMPHPILGDVPICSECRNKIESMNSRRKE
jgi:hypothetical protein